MKQNINEKIEKEVKDPVEEILTEAVKEVEEVNKEYAVIANALNLRKEPNDKAPIIKVLHSGDIVKARDNTGTIWTNLTEPAGYVMSKYIAPKKG